MTPYTLPLPDPGADIETAGGKGASLARIAQAGLPVPGGFHITTAAYLRFVSENKLQDKILGAAAGIDPDQPPSFEAASEKIVSLFARTEMPEDIMQAVRAEYARLGADAEPVAVRSSATAEDLPGMSFAGQQETYLNIRGAEAVLDAVRKCWASLWTARAIAYRSRQGIASDSVTIAVIVQKLVPADASGVLFTANPLSGDRGEILINAAWGLGEALVSGEVTPDTLTLEKSTGRMIGREIAAKTTMTARDEKGTHTAPIPLSQQRKAVLNDIRAAELAGFGREIEKLYGSPMDIEWALAGGSFAILQARPITALPEPPLEWTTPYAKPFLARGSSIDLVPDVVSPLFLTLGLPILSKVFKDMYTEVMGLRQEDQPIFEVINGYIFLCFPDRGKFWNYMRAHVATAGKLFKYGSEKAKQTNARYPKIIARWQQQDLESKKASDLLDGARELFSISAEFFNISVDEPIPQSNFSGYYFSIFYNLLIKRKVDPPAEAFLLGLDTIPMRAEKSLFNLAQLALANSQLAEYLRLTPLQEIGQAILSDLAPVPLSGAFSEAFRNHLAEFGHLTYDLDFRNPVPADHPEAILDTLKIYLSGKGSDPLARQEAQESYRKQAEQAILRRVDPLRRKQFQKLLASAQDWAIQRENAIAVIGRPYPQLRRVFQELGRRLVKGRAIAQPEDLYWLEAGELEELAACLDKNTPLKNLSASVNIRKAYLERARKAEPPVVLPENHMLAKMYSPKKPEPHLLRGKGTSAGQITATACVLRGPEDFALMRPGDVLVAVATTPAWTPLFAMASAVVTDIGGPLSHSSIVAREYGIPAVMATGVATRRIHTGQMITVDGSSGSVKLLD